MEVCKNTGDYSAIFNFTNHEICQIWRKYFDHYKICHLPVPFNVPEMMMNLVLRMIKRKNGDENVEAGVAKQTEERQKEYLNLVSKLCGRYIHMKNRNAEKKANIS